MGRLEFASARVQNCIVREAELFCIVITSDCVIAQLYLKIVYVGMCYVVAHVPHVVIVN